MTDKDYSEEDYSEDDDGAYASEIDVRPKERQRRILHQEETQEVSSDDEFFCPVKHVEKDIQKTKVYTNIILVHLDNIMVTIEPDSGSEVNLVDEHQIKRSNITQRLNPSSCHHK